MGAKLVYASAMYNSATLSSILFAYVRSRPSPPSEEV